MTRIIIVGGGVAGAEAGTFLGENTKKKLEIIEIECNPMRRFGGWGFQSFPVSESTNLAMRKMYLGENPENILEWSKICNRSDWPTELQNFQFNVDMTFPRTLMQKYVAWRRNQVKNDLVSYNPIFDEVIKVHLNKETLGVELKETNRIIEGDRIVMASGSTSVKIPDYLKNFTQDEKVIIDPLTLEGHNRRNEIPQNARILVLGTGLTGEEQMNILIKSGHTKLTLFSREGKRHFSYPKKQSNLNLTLTEPPGFLKAETPEEFSSQMTDFFSYYLNQGHSPEDIFSAIRPFWEGLRKELGGCLKAADKLREFKRDLATNSIGVPWEVSENLRKAESKDYISVIHGSIIEIEKRNNQFQIQFKTDSGIQIECYDWIINAIGRNIIKHPVWDELLSDGIAIKHAGIGIQVSETGRMLNQKNQESHRIWVVGMARAGDHTLRHGFLGNTAFNIPQIRAHIYTTIRDLLTTIQ